jgi:TetR/AcrR family acrAB operon transcriptional repressor
MFVKRRERREGETMVRRTKEQARVTRERLLTAALRVFRARGTTRTSLAEVAATAGVTRGAVYWHFRDKAELFGAMCERMTLPLETMAREAGVGATDDPLGALRAMNIASLTHLASDPRSQAVLDVVFHKSELVGELAIGAARQKRVRNSCLAQNEVLLRDAVERGQLPPDTDTALAAQALHAFMVGTMYEWITDRRAYDLAAAAAALVDTILAGLRSCPPRRAAAAAASRPHAVSRKR